MTNLANKLFYAAAATLICATANAQDECTTAVPLSLGATPFDTSNATTSPELWPCGSAVANDLWWQFTAPNSANYYLTTCNNTSFDTVLEVFTGSCGALTSFMCNDDACSGFFSGLTFNANAGDSFFIRIGGWSGASGQGVLEVTEIPRDPDCLTTLFNANNAGSSGGAVYFDLAVTEDVNINSLETNFNAVTGTAVGMELYTTPGSATGNQTNPAAWTLAGMDDGTASAIGGGGPTPINLLAPVNLASGSWGIALVAIGSGHRYRNGDGMNQNYTDGTMSLALGSATNVPFTGNVFQPRVWNGSICYTSASGPIGSNYCGPAVPNSTALPGVISGSGSANVSTNDVTLTADQLPPGQFGYFLTSETQGFFMPPGSVGNICLGGNIGRYNGDVGTGPSFSLTIDLTSMPVNPVQAVLPGEDWNFQAWYRDVGNTNNFTDGLNILFN